MKNKSIGEIFLFILMDKGKRSLYSSSTYMVYYSLFSILKIDDLNLVLAEAYKNRKQGWWFEAFHKTIRQTDFYTDCYRLDPNPTLDENEQKELRQLEIELSKVDEELKIFEKKLRLTVPDINHPNYIQKEAEYSIAYKKYYRELFPEEKRKRRFELRTKLNNKEKTSITGLLDGILWNFIHVDDSEILVNSLQETFEEFLKQKREATKKKMVKK